MRPNWLRLNNNDDGASSLRVVSNRVRYLPPSNEQLDYIASLLVPAESPQPNGRRISNRLRYLASES